jgi:hypothetical protein
MAEWMRSDLQIKKSLWNTYSTQKEMGMNNEIIELSLDDYQTYVQPVLIECHTDIDEYSRIFLEKYLKEDKDISRKEMYDLFRLICSFREYTFDPLIVIPGIGGGSLSDISTNHLVFLQSILEKISNPLVQARVADILWVIQKKDKKENAKIALKAYMILVEDHFKDQKKNDNIVEYIERILFLSKWIKDNNDHKKTIKKIETLIQEEILDFSTNDIILRLIKEKESDKNLLISILEEKIKHSDSLDDWKTLEKVYSKLGKDQEVDNCKIRQGEMCAQYGDQLEDNLNKMYWYQESLAIYPNTKETKDRIKEINNKLSISSNSSFKEMQHYEIHLSSQAVSDYIQEKSVEINKKISGSSFLEAVKTLVGCIEYPSIEEIKREVEIEQSNLLGLFSPVINSSQVTNVNSQSRCESLNSDNWETALAVYFTQRYFPSCTSIMLCPVMERLEIIRKEHSNIKKDDWITILKKSIIPKERLESFSLGFYNWFHKSNLEALPILIPQFENLIRYFIQDSQNDTAVYRNKERKQEEESFKNNFNNETIENKLGRDLVFQFKVLLFANGGFNLRNTIEHGLLDDRDFSDFKIDYLVLLMLKVVLFCSSKDTSGLVI